MTLKEANDRARDAVKWMLESEFFRENFYNIREREAEAFADEILSKIRAEFHAAGFVMAPEVATGVMNQKGIEAISDAMERGMILSPGGVFAAMLAARQKLDDA